MKKIAFTLTLFYFTFSFAQSGTLVVLNKSDDTADLFNLETLKSIATLPTGEGPHEVAISPNGNTAVVTDYGRENWPGKSLTVIDILSRKVKKTISLESYAPHGIEFISENQVLVTCEFHKKLIQVNIETGKTEKTINTDQEVSHMLAYAPKSKKAFVANIRSGSVSVIDLENDKLEKIIKTGKGAEGITLSADGKTILVSNRSDNTITTIDAKSLEVKNEFSSNDFPIRIKATLNAKYILVSNAKSGDVKVFNAKSYKLIKTIPMTVKAIEKEKGRLFQDFKESPVPVGILITPDNKFAFIANTNADIVTIIDLQSLEISGRIKTGKEPDGLGYTSLTLD